MTASSIRKHVSQMTSEEREFFQSYVKSLEWIVGFHIRQRMTERGGSIADIIEAIEHGELVEYHQKNGASRLLFRGKKPIHRWVPCVVVELMSRKMITVYWNHEKDEHSTIDMSRYDEELEVIGLFKGEERDEMARRTS